MTSSFSNNMPPQVVTARIFSEETAAYLDRLRFAASEAARTFEDAGDAMSWSPTIDAINRLKEVLQGGYEYHPDDSAVDRFAEAMRDKMEESREKGRSGWDSPFQCSPYRLANMLIDHLAKGDPVDVGNFAMMLFNRPDARGVLARVWALRFDQIAASPADQVGWRPIETAPKDGTDIILHSPGRTTIGHWTTDEECRVDIGDCGGECHCREYEFIDPSWVSWDGGFTEEHPPTHWMPLPPTP